MDWISGFIVAILSGCYTFFTCKVLSSKEIGQKKLLLFAMNVLGFHIGHIFLPVDTKMFMTMGIIILNLIIFRDDKPIKLFGMMIGIILILAINDTLYGLLFMALGFTVSEMQSILILKMTLLIMVLSTSFVITFYVFNRNEYIKWLQNKFPTNQRKSIILFVIMTICILAFNTYSFQNADLFMNVTNVVVLLTLYVLYGLVVFRFIFLNHKLVDKTEAYDELKFYTDIMEELIDGTHKFQHDQNNMIMTCLGYLEANEYEGLNKYFSTFVKTNQQLYNNDFSMLKYIPDAGIKGLLTTKLQEMVANNVILDLHVEEKMIIDFDCFNLSRILGVFLDNAFEAAIKSDEPYIMVKFLYDDELTIVIKNSYGPEPKLGQVFEAGYTTKKDSKGYGLNNVKTIIDKHNLLLNTTIENNLFIQELLI